MFDSLQKLRALDDAIKVYPGHGYSGDSTTIGREKQNGLLRPFSRDQWRSMHG
jgi:glyoxylase-like metal-dependent hydrolase (beta-lactamase superfamily II)